MKLLTRMKILYVLRQVGETLLFSFFSLYLSLRGFSDYQVGELMGIVPVVMLFATPLLGLVDDGGKNEKTLLVTANMLIALVPLLLLIGGIDYFWMAVLLAVMSAIRAPICPATDSLATLVAINNSKRFSNIRIWGSISYAVLMAFGGALIDEIGFNNIIIISGALTFCSAILIASIPLQNLDKPAESSKKGDYKKLFANKKFLAFVLVVIFTWATWSASYNFEGVYYAEKFSNAGMFGYVESLRVVFEVLAMLLLAKLKKPLSVRFVFFFFALCAMAKYAVYYFDLPAYSLFALAPPLGAAFGMILFYYVEYIARIVPKHNIHIAIFTVTSAQYLLNATYTYIGSAIVRYHGFSNVYLLFFAITAAGLLLIPLIKRDECQAK